MTRVYMIRHGKPSTTWGQSDDTDPGLDDTGRIQAEVAAQALLALPKDERPVRVVASPLRRCRETAEPFAKALGVELEIDPSFGEIPSPDGLSLTERAAWLKDVFGGRWDEATGDIDYDVWRRGVAHALGARGGTAVFSHFVAINAAVSTVTGRDVVLSFRPDHCSITTFDIEGENISLHALGREAQTGVL
jgi:broad specificity phosphatase PhoE